MTVPASAHRHLAPVAERRLAAQRFVLVSPSHAGNIGSVARAMTAMGLRDLVIVAPREPAFAADPQAVALASGATGLLTAARVVPTLGDALADCQFVIAVSADPREFGPGPDRPPRIAEQAWQALASGRADRVAWLFGPERTGLSIADVALSQAMVTIPADPDFSSLNLSQAVQVIAYVLRERALAETEAQAAGGPEAQIEGGTEAQVEGGIEAQVEGGTGQQAEGGMGGRGSGPAPDPAVPSARRLHPKAAEAESLADRAAVEGLFTHLERALVTIGFLDPAHPKKLMARLRRLFARTGLERAEVELLRGVCKQIEITGRRATDDPDRR